MDARTSATAHQPLGSSHGTEETALLAGGHPPAHAHASSSGGSPQPPRSRRRRLIVMVAVGVVVAAIITLAVALGVSQARGPPATSPAAFEQLVRQDAVFAHLEGLQAVANTSAAFSRSVLNAYPQSVAYVRGRLNATGGYFALRQQDFKAPVWEQTATPTLNVTAVTFEAGRDFNSLRWVPTTAG